jgi:DNA-binding MarR family transcriptional regulator
MILSSSLISPHAKRDTSLQAFIDLQSKRDKLGKLQDMVYYYILNNPDSTDKEISEILSIPINCITARRNELVKLGIIESVFSRKCTITGRTALCWRVCNE